MDLPHMANNSRITPPKTTENTCPSCRHRGYYTILSASFHGFIISSPCPLVDMGNRTTSSPNQYGRDLDIQCRQDIATRAIIMGSMAIHPKIKLGNI
jgi:hypothetical protein